jgi:hypothetical protein
MFKRKYFRDETGRRISRVIIPHPPVEIFRKYSTMRDEFKRKLKEKKTDEKTKKADEDYVDRIMRLNKSYGQK